MFEMPGKFLVNKEPQPLRHRASLESDNLMSAVAAAVAVHIEPISLLFYFVLFCFRLVLLLLLFLPRIVEFSCKATQKHVKSLFDLFSSTG